MEMEPDEIHQIHCDTNAEIRSILAELDDHTAGDKKAEALLIRLRSVLSRRFLVNGVADMQAGEE